MCLCVSGDSLSYVALGGGVEGGQLDRVGVLWPHFKQHFLKRVELIVFVHVVLVDLRTRKRLSCADLLRKVIETLEEMR